MSIHGHRTPELLSASEMATLARTLGHRPCLHYGINRLQSNTAEEDSGVLTLGRLSSNPHCPWAVLKANSILGCIDKGKCTFIVNNCSEPLQPNNCSGAFLKELDYLELLLQ